MQRRRSTKPAGSDETGRHLPPPDRNRHRTLPAGASLLASPGRLGYSPPLPAGEHVQQLGVTEGATHPESLR